MSKSLVKINIRGGILSPGDLRTIVGIASHCGCVDIHLGERQNIYLHVHAVNLDRLHEGLTSSSFDYEVDANEYPNIISSYVSENIFTTYNNWVSEGVYRDILDSFNYRPKLKINVVDKAQGLVPLFTGNLNFISSESPNFWYLYVRKKSAIHIECWPELIYSTEISTLSNSLEMYMAENPDDTLHQLVQKTKERHKLITLDLPGELVIPKTKLPYYEGLAKADHSYWLGIYRRNNDFKIDFLESLCDVCTDTKLGLVQLTTWKTLLIKGISEANRINWEKLLGRHGINIRHSAVELNWQIKDGDKEAVKLKNYLVKKLNKSDVRTYGLSFAIKSGPMNVAASVVIDKIRMPGEMPGEVLNRYEISYAEGFNANKQEFTRFATGISKKKLKNSILKLCKYYYNQLNSEPVISAQKTAEEKELPALTKIHQCTHCLNIYDPQYGDVINDIPPGILFKDLSDNYNCAVCEHPKADFIEKEWPRLLKTS